VLIDYTFLSLIDLKMSESDHLAALYTSQQKEVLFFIKTLKWCLPAWFGTLTMVLLNA